ncbi:CPBP family intramembrane glutamic endopeptidase [Amycolatopsis thermoflava]|uniref:CPBP family intramembrane glutamic endopeptidase n=1 Tax=Amycolatopsis thermoflava TaxID=84480 RepID=UPI000407F6CF|nr:CPBP family intramembrane glutamic endopeptidase [Amycolatopsis thermoflava]
MKTALGLVTAAGAGLLGHSLSRKPGSAEFVGSTAAVAGVWAAGSLLDRTPAGRIGAGPVAAGVGAFVLFRAGAEVARRIPVLRRALQGVLRYATAGNGGAVLLTTLANGAAEELFFRGPVYNALGATGSTAVYVLATTATRNPALVAASAVMGAVFAWQRRSGGGVLAPVMTHVVWSALMVWRLPALVPEKAGP